MYVCIVLPLSLCISLIPFLRLSSFLSLSLQFVVTRSHLQVLVNLCESGLEAERHVISLTFSVFKVKLNTYTFFPKFIPNFISCLFLFISITEAITHVSQEMTF